MLYIPTEKHYCTDSYFRGTKVMRESDIFSLKNNYITGWLNMVKPWLLVYYHTNQIELTIVRFT